MPLTQRSTVLLFWLVGIVLHVVAVYLRSDPSVAALIYKSVGIVSALTLIAGSALYARAKGYSLWLGLAGILSILGIAALIVLPPRNDS